MMERLIHCYQSLRKIVNMDITEEDFAKSINILNEFISGYNFSFVDTYFMDNNYYLEFIRDEAYGFVKIDSKGICAEVNKPGYYGFTIKEYLMVSGDKFEGEFSSFAFNESDTLVTINNIVFDAKGSIVTTAFNNVGAYLGNKFIKYNTNDNIEKMREALRIHCENGRIRRQDFMIYEDLNIKSINFVDEGFEKGKSKIF